MASDFFVVILIGEESLTVEFSVKEPIGGRLDFYSFSNGVKTIYIYIYIYTQYSFMNLCILTPPFSSAFFFSCSMILYYFM